jgi:hypothetical protein
MSAYRNAFVCFACLLTSMCAREADAQQAPRDLCAVPEASQFDFWIGDWDVFRPDGKHAGTNRIERLYGCGVHESWNGGKLLGQSFNRWDGARGVWHQTWVDSQGGLLLLEGVFRDGAMTLTDATVPGRKDPERMNEVRWTAATDGSVRQVWRASRDGGKTWNVVFDGRYVRSSRPQPTNEKSEKSEKK